MPDPLTFIWNQQTNAFEQMQPGENTGYDLVGAFVGSEGCFGVALAAPAPVHIWEKQDLSFTSKRSESDIDPKFASCM